MLLPTKTYKTDGDNTTKRFSMSSQNRFNATRRILRGFPAQFKFRTAEDINRYFSGDRIQCLLCGKWYVMLGKHILNIHGVTVDQYKKKYGLPWGRGLVAKDTETKMSENCKRRMAAGEINFGPDHISKEKLSASWKTKRPVCSAHRRAAVKRGTAAIIKWNEEHPAKPKHVPEKSKRVIATEIYRARDKKVAELKQQNKTAKEIADALNVRVTTVKRSLKRSGLSKPRSEIVSESEDIKKTVISLYLKGFKQKNIAKTINRSLCRTQQIIGEYRQKESNAKPSK